MVKLSSDDYRQRAAEMRALAARSVDPQFKQSCLNMADGWALLALQEEALEKSREPGDRGQADRNRPAPTAKK